MEKLSFCRRAVIKSAVFGLLTSSIPHIIYARKINAVPEDPNPDDLFHRYPAIDDELVKEVVGASHFNLERVRELVDRRPELSRATWDWGFGDWETAIGAASHVGRRDIAMYLMAKGARPDIFTFAMLGHYRAVKAMIESVDNVQTIAGPHGISLLRHAKSGLRDREKLTRDQLRNSEVLIQYLEGLGNAGEQEVYLDMMPEEKEKYLGDYKYGDGDSDGFSIKLNMRKMLSLGKIGNFGGALNRISSNEYVYNGVSSVSVSFNFEAGKVISLTIKEPDLELTAKKIS